MSPMDPRYDARFQRGFTGEGEGAGDSSSSAAAAEVGPSAKGATRRAVQQAERIATSAVRIEPLATIAPPGGPERRSAEDELDELLRATAGTEELDDEREVHDDALDDELDDESEFEPRQGRNPWVIALWVVSIALIILPGIYFWQSQFAMSGSSWSGSQPPFDFVIGQLVVQLTPTIISTGALGVLLAVSLHAVAWESRTREKR